MMVLAENQRYAAALLERAGAVRMFLPGSPLNMQINHLINELVSVEGSLRRLVESASRITDGQGCALVSDFVLGKGRRK
jgi:hypothetical protein